MRGEWWLSILRRQWEENEVPESEAQAAYATTRGLCVFPILAPSGLLMGALLISRFISSIRYARKVLSTSSPRYTVTNRSKPSVSKIPALVTRSTSLPCCLLVPIFRAGSAGNTNVSNLDDGWDVLDPPLGPGWVRVRGGLPPDISSLSMRELHGASLTRRRTRCTPWKRL